MLYSWAQNVVLQHLRLFSGLVLFTYVSTHLLNHSLGMISLQAAEAGRLVFTAVWRHPLATSLLYGGLLTHLTLVLYALYQRRHLRIPRWEILRLCLGLLIPVLLIRHAFGTRVIHEVAGIDDTYTRQVTIFWVLNPEVAIHQVVLLTVAWVHGCLGIHYWLRVKRWHALTLPVLRVLGPLVPILALAGFVNMGLDVSSRAQDPAWLAETVPQPPPELAVATAQARDRLILLFLGSVAFVFAAREVRTMLQHRRRGTVRVTYPDGRQVPIIPGTTVLEASRAAGIPHASLCGGRGRCSTCRVRVGAGADLLPKPAAAEARVLRRIGAPPKVRLACQLRPASDLEVFPLLSPRGLPRTDLLGPDAAGAECEIAILFADLRSFTKFAEHRLPYDVVFVLNQYFAAVGRAVERSGGYLDKFIGDGVMALFGLESDPGEGCRAALGAAVTTAHALDELNRTLAHDMGKPLRIGIGIHVGQVIVGTMGHGRARSLTAIGDAVNTASRLEALTKEYAAQLVISEDVARRADLDLSAFPCHYLEIRGRSTPLEVRVIGSALALEGILAAPAPSTG